MPAIMFFTLISSLMLYFSTPVAGFWRLLCPSMLVKERADPIITPGEVSGHVHTIAGGNGFGFSMNYTQARESTCSSCMVKQDASNYWVPQLYFHAQNGSFIEVPISGTYNGFLGGMTVYYLQRAGPNNDKLHAFPEGFRMVAGHPFRRHMVDTFPQQAISFQCLDYSGTQGGSIQTNHLPTTKCPNGVRGQVFFPSCWNGKDLDTPDHHSHMRYPDSQAYNAGPCPASHPVHMISLFYEVIFETDVFSDDWYSDQQPFVFAHGDPTGYGFHGDFYNGWDVNVLQQAVDQCTDMSGDINKCPFFDFYSWDESQACHLPATVQEDVVGPMDKLPGCNPIQWGPEEAKVSYEENCPATKVSNAIPGVADLTKSMHWEYIGCGFDNDGDRTFTGAQGYNTTETLEQCVAFCASQGYQYAGAEYSTQCYCDNTLRADRAPQPGVLGECSMRCAGNSKEFCGGPGAMSIYRKCDSSSCKNAAFSAPGMSGSAKRDKSVRRGLSG